MNSSHPLHRPFLRRPLVPLLCGLALSLSWSARAADTSAAETQQLKEKIREAMQADGVNRKQLPVLVNGKEQKVLPEPVTARPPARRAPVVPVATAQQYPRARAVAHGQRASARAPAAADSHAHEVHWSYEGEGGPDNWSKLNPDYKTCASGQRQSPIAIEDAATLQGPAEAIQFNYQPANGTVVNNGHTIQVNVEGDNSILVRGTSYKLLQFHFHAPSEERINGKTYPLVAHLVHRSEQGQLAVVAVLFAPGQPNRLIDKVWTYMPLDVNDSVRMPPGLINLKEVLPQDQRYYQFMGSLTTPPCSEGVLWQVLKQAVSISPEQLKLFTQLYPMNARPVQPLNGRPVRNAQ